MASVSLVKLELQSLFGSLMIACVCVHRGGVGGGGGGGGVGGEEELPAANHS